jgi:hypothetical protein
MTPRQIAIRTALLVGIGMLVGMGIVEAFSIVP